MKKLIAVGYSTFLFVLTAFGQTSLNSSYFQTLTARALGPSTMSGRITAIEGIVTSEQLNLYVGTAGGGIWKSQNGGVSFSPVFDKYNQSIGAIAIDKTNPRIVYASNLAFVLFLPPCIKNETVIGIMGNTQGVRIASKPAKNENQKNHKSEEFLADFSGLSVTLRVPGLIGSVLASFFTVSALTGSVITGASAV